MNLYFKDEAFSFELLRNVGYAVYGGADIGECFSTAGRIKEGDDESWYREWLQLADRVRGYAEECFDKKHLVSAREAYLRASNYYRACDFFLRENPDSDPRVAENSRLTRECFARVAELSKPQIEILEIPYEGKTLPAHFYKVDDSGEPRPTLIFSGGYDSVLEEMYFCGAAAAIRHGYNCLCFDGPGQGIVILERKLPFRPDWEKVVTSVVDYALTRREIDPEKMCLLGMSMGGQLAPRAAAFEHRLAALVCFDGVYGLDSFLQALPPVIRQWVSSGVAPQLEDEMLEMMMHSNTQLRWFVRNGMWKFGVDSPSEVYRTAAKYTLDGVVEQISCPTLVLKAETDQFFPGEPEKLYEALRCPKKLVSFTEDEGAGAHCQEGAMLLFHQRLFDWMDETLDLGSNNEHSLARAAVAAEVELQAKGGE